MPRILHLRRWITRTFTRFGFPSDFVLLPVAALVGALGGVVAAGFDAMLGLSKHFLFDYFLVQDFHGFHVVWLIVLPAAGGLAMGLIQQFVTRTEPGKGVPEIVEALTRKRGEMPLRMGLSTAINSTLTIGTGGSAGVEGPIIKVGSVMGSLASKHLHVGNEYRHVLVGCGAAAGMAGIFNAPIAAVIFVLEVILRDFSLKTFMPIVVASVFGTAVTQALLGENVTVFRVPDELYEYQFTILEMGHYTLLGVLCAVVGVLFIKSLIEAEKLGQRSRVPMWLRPAIGGLLLGVLGIVFVLMFDKPAPHHSAPLFFGNGYPVIEALFNDASYRGVIAGDADAGVAESVRLNGTLAVLAAAVAFKIIGTACTLGSGGSGGIIAPSLFIGATLGGLFASAAEQAGLMPIDTATPATYALAGMAGLLAATAHCPLTAFLLIFELTQDYKVILPVMIVAILGTVGAQFLHRDSIYTHRLRQLGIRFGAYSDMTLLSKLSVSHVPLAPAVTVHPSDPVQRLIDLAEQYAVTDYAVVDDNGCYTGMVVGDDVKTTLMEREAIPLMIVAEVMRTDLPTVTAEQSLEVVLDKFSNHEVSSLAVTDESQKVSGMITRSRLMRRYQQAIDQG